MHGHGGIILEAYKNHVLSWDLGPGDRLMWFTTTAWMMWNALVSTLLTGASIVCLDGNPMWPDLDAQWRIAEDVRPTMMGLGPAFVMTCVKQGKEPAATYDLSSLRMLSCRRLTAPDRRVRVAARTVRDPRAGLRRQRRHRRVHRARAGLSDRAGVRRRDVGEVPRRRGLRVRRGRQLGRRRARRARDRRTDAVDAGALLGRRRRHDAVPRHLLRAVPRRDAFRRLGAVQRTRHGRRHRPLRRHPQPRRRAHRDRRDLPRRRAARRGRRQSRRAHRRPGGRARAS